MNKNFDVSRNTPCPCGSGKKYKRCCALKDEQGAFSQRRLKRTLKWITGVAVVLLIGYGIFRSGLVNSPVRDNRRTYGGLQGIVYYTETDIDEVDFSKLAPAQKKEALDEANKIRCTCGCGMTLAQCVAIDSTCPLRSSNIKQIRDLVKKENG